MLTNNDHEFMSKIADAIQDKKSMPLTIQEFIDKAGLHYSVSGFNKRFYSLLGIRPGKFLKALRFFFVYNVIKENPDMSGREIARICRFANHSDLSRFLHFRNTSLTQIREYGNNT